MHSITQPPLPLWPLTYSHEPPWEEAMFHQACMKGQRSPLVTALYSEIGVATIRNTEVKEAQGMRGETSTKTALTCPFLDQRIFVNKLE